MPTSRNNRNRIRKDNIRNFEIEQIEEQRINKGKPDPIILISLIILVTFGVVMVFSASYYVAKRDYGDIFFYFKRQAIFAIIGFAVMPLVVKIDWTIYKRFAKMLYAVSIILLILVLIISDEKKGAKRWLSIGSLSIQPSEIAKIGLILWLSKYISDNKNILNTWGGFFKCLIIILIPTGLTLLGNTSTGIIMFCIGIAILFVASPTIKYFIPAGFAGIIGLIGILKFGKNFRSARIEAWLNPFADGVKSDVGFQIVQSLYSIASGGFFGLGIGQSRQKLGFLPEVQNDIIFSVICEELGLAGATIFVILFSSIILRGYIVSTRVPKSFMSYVCVGITTMIAIQVVINIAVATNTMPNTGIPLPFVSYGGTSLLIMMCSTGLILNFSRYFRD